MSKRKSIEIEGFGHGANPIPAASRVGNVVMTGGISGLDPATHTVSGEPEAQVEQMFKNLKAILEAAGGSLEDLVKLSVSVKSLTLREAINKQWIAYFPDAASRPARHVVQYDHFGGAVAIQCEAYAVID